MPIQNLSIQGYRSLFRIHLGLDQINVLVGPNGCGKSNLYRSLYLLSRAAQGQLSRALAEEGGLPSALWAGKRYKGPVRMSLHVRMDDLAYELVCGLPSLNQTAFVLDPEIKEEHIWYFKGKQKVHMLKRKGSFVRLRDADGNWVEFVMEFADSESILSELREPEKFPALSVLRLEFLNWRFYHQFRTDPQSPLRQPQAGVRTTSLSHDGSDLAAALQTIIESDNHDKLQHAIQSAFPNAEILTRAEGGFCVSMSVPGILRELSAKELSDGTLQYLCMLAVFLSPRPPTFLAINEPETSLHPNLLDPLAQLIVQASERSQIWITTHSDKLADLIAKHSGTVPLRIGMEEGETTITRKKIDEED